MIKPDLNDYISQIIFKLLQTYLRLEINGLSRSSAKTVTKTQMAWFRQPANIENTLQKIQTSSKSPRGKFSAVGVWHGVSGPEPLTRLIAISARPLPCGPRIVTNSTRLYSRNHPILCAMRWDRLACRHTAKQIRHGTKQRTVGLRFRLVGSAGSGLRP